MTLKIIREFTVALFDKLYTSHKSVFFADQLALFTV